MDTYRYSVCYSPDERGYYVEIIGANCVTVEVLPRRGVWRRRRTADVRGWARTRELESSSARQAQ